MPIRIIHDILDFTNKSNEQSILFAADFQAAFDSTDYTFMFEVLRKFNFHENFIKWIKLLHYNVESCVLNNGYSTGYFKLEWGTRQGDPIAAYLFIIVLEILACMVRQNNEIKGIKVNSNEMNLCMYADDSTFFRYRFRMFRNTKKNN